MPHTLITFLGGSNKSGSRYEEVTYRFENGNNYTKNFFGIALLEHLQAEGNNKPDKFVVLGTTGSMWDAFYELLDDANPLEQEEYDKYIKLGEIIEYNSENQKQQDVPYLKELETQLTEHLGIPCELRLIPYGKPEEQTDILLKIAQCVQEKEIVSLDITHGLRHLPMLVILSAMYLQAVKQVKIAGIYYGAKEMQHLEEDNMTPAFNLGGLLQIAKWVGALNSFNKDGDYAVFAELLQADGLEAGKTKHLEDAAFFERIFNVPQAASKLTAFRNQTPDKLPGIGSLFSDILNDRTGWVTKGNLYERQRQLAYFFLNNKDYPRAAIFAVEAFITHLMTGKSEQDIRDYRKRKGTEYDFLDGKLGNIDKIGDFRLLKKLRNTMAHSNILEGEDVEEAMASENTLGSKLKELMDRLFK